MSSSERLARTLTRGCTAPCWAATTRRASCAIGWKLSQAYTGARSPSSVAQALQAHNRINCQATEILVCKQQALPVYMTGSSDNIL